MQHHSTLDQYHATLWHDVERSGQKNLILLVILENIRNVESISFNMVDKRVEMKHIEFNNVRCWMEMLEPLVNRLLFA